MYLSIILLGDQMELFSVVIRTLFFYIFITISYRLMGKREIGQLGVIDLIVSILMAELVAISIENTEDPMYLTIIPLSILVFLEIVIAYISVKNQKIRILLEGKPSLIISNGTINYHEMIKQRYTLNDLLLQLRQKEIKDISQVEYAFLESNGKLSIFKYKPFQMRGNYPMPVILDGKIEDTTLKYLRKNRQWLENILLNQNVELKNVFYAFYKKQKIFIIKKSGF
ncbi:MAG: DUF421 domain-containing protein [Firmicutes bacterium]|nr:DUF421 domain-containing protein [Bacillota bacterium]